MTVTDTLPGAALPLIVAVKPTSIVAVFPGSSGPKGAGVTLYGPVAAPQLPLRTPLPLFLMIRLAVTWTPTLPLIDKGFGGDKAPGNPVPLKLKVAFPALLTIIAVALLLVPFGVKVTVSFCDFPAARVN